VVVDPEIPASILPLASMLRKGVPEISDTVKISPVRSSVISNNLPEAPSIANTVPPVALADLRIKPSPEAEISRLPVNLCVSVTSSPNLVEPDL